METSLGARAGAVTSLLIAVGFTIAIAGVFAMSGGMISLTLEHYASWHPSWLPIALVISLGGARGRAARERVRSTVVVAAALIFQVATMVATCVVVLVTKSPDP